MGRGKEGEGGERVGEREGEGGREKKGQDDKRWSGDRGRQKVIRKRESHAEYIVSGRRNGMNDQVTHAYCVTMPSITIL